MQHVQLLIPLSSLILVATASCTPPDRSREICASAGGRYEVREEKPNLLTGYCVFPDNTECQVYGFTSGQCKPGQNPSNPSSIPTVTPYPTFSPINHELIFFTQPITQSLKSDSSIKGVLGLVGRCLGLDSDRRYGLIWPSGFRYQFNTQEEVEVLDTKGQMIVKLGQMVSITGKESQHSMSLLQDETICPGPYWLVGDQIRQSN